MLPDSLLARYELALYHYSMKWIYVHLVLCGKIRYGRSLTARSQVILLMWSSYSDESCTVVYWLVVGISRLGSIFLY